MNENPQLCNVRGFNVNYADLNNNKEPDDDEYVTAILPNYTGIDVQESAKYMTDAFSSKVLEGKFVALRYFHDQLVEETTIVPRNSTLTSSTVHGAVIEKKADALGLARAMCGYAQKLDFHAYVAEMEVDDAPNHVWVRVKIDGNWYNIDPYYDTFMNTAVSSIPVSDNISHNSFLVGDKNYFGEDAKISDIVSDEKFYPLFISDSEELSPNENYYFEKYLGLPYYHSVDTAYNAVLEETQNQLNNGAETVTVYLEPDYVNDLWAKMQESYISDLAGKGITISEFTGEFYDDSVHITLKK